MREEGREREGRRGADDKKIEYRETKMEGGGQRKKRSTTDYRSWK